MRICIDAGHNYDNYDTGAVGNGLKEQEVTFKIAERLKSLLVGAGVDVTMTRAKITDNVGSSASDSINQRARIANTTKCDYFISIHCNSSTSKSASGTETLICGRGGKAESLATCVTDEISKLLGLKNRGVKVDAEYLKYTLGVLRLTDMPAILIETAFISNADDARLLKNNVNEFAQAIFEGILEITGVGLVQKDEIGEIIDIISGIVEINDKNSAISVLYRAKTENSSLYWILKKLADKFKKGESV